MRVISVLLLLNALRPVLSASSRAHAAIDRAYDELDDETVGIGVIKTVNEPVTAAANVATRPSPFDKLDETLLLQIASFIEEPFAFTISCKLFYMIVAAYSRYRVFGQKLILSGQFNLQACAESTLSLPAIIKAFGNGDLTINSAFLAQHLELALYSPSIRKAFDFRMWNEIRKVPFFKELTETILMDSFDSVRRPVSPAIESHRRTLLYILASLPLNSEYIERFFHEYPIKFINPVTASCFDKLSTLISERLAILPIDLITSKVLSYFSFDARIISNLVINYLQTGNHFTLKRLLNVNIPEAFKVTGKSYFGCIPVVEFVYYTEMYLNLFDPDMIEILSLLDRKQPAHFSPFLTSLLGKYSPHLLDIFEIFQIAVLKSLWEVLEEFPDFDFSYEKGDSEFFTFLIERNQNYANYLLSRFPKLASHRAFLLNTQYQGRHFETFTNLRRARVELKRTIYYPEITKTHIIYIQNYQDRLFYLLVSDSAERISNYFTMNLKGFERKRYKEHPSFNIALTTLDVFFEYRMSMKSYLPEVNPETVLKTMLSALNYDIRNTEEYFELAHGLPSFVTAIFSGAKEEEDSLAVPEAALTQNLNEFEMLSRTIALNRVIRDGTSTNYRLVLKWFEQFGTRIVGRIIPRHELKNLLKGAAFQTIRSSNDKKLKFDLDSQYRDEPFSMTYRYALIILVTQCKGIPAAVLKRVKNLFPGANFAQSEGFTNLLNAACRFHRQHSAFFSRFSFVATNSRSERFLIDFIRHFIRISDLKNAAIDVIVNQFFAFINLDPENEILLRDHFVYFTLLASF